VVFEHKAARTTSGTVELKVRRDLGRTEGSPVVRVSAPAVRIDDEFPDLDEQRFVARIDVGAAAADVLKGAELVISRSMAVCIGVESRKRWDGPWRDRDVARFLHERGFVLIARDVVRPRRFNLVFVHRSVAGNPIVARHAARVYRPVRRSPEASHAPRGLLRRAVGGLSRAARRRTPRG
jgi:hypothetical protein